MKTILSFVSLSALALILTLTLALTTAFPLPAQAADVLLFGGSRGVGLEAARILTDRGDQVTAFVRPTSDRSGLEPLGVAFAVGDVLEADSVRAIFAAGDFSLVVTSLGAARGEGNSVDDLGMRNVIDAAKAAGVSRFVMVSAIGVGSSKDAIPPNIYKILEPSLISKGVGERYLAGSGLAYAIVRPGGLDNGPATGTFHNTENPAGPFDRVNRGEVARLVIEAVDDENASGNIFHVAKR